MSSDVYTVPSLPKLCIEAAASDVYWRVQTRHLEVLPEEYVNALVNELIKRGRLPPVSLYKFRHALTEICIKRQRISTLKRWIPSISTLPLLRSLTLSSKQSVFWQPLPELSSLASSLQSLTLEGLSGYGMSSTVNTTLRNTLRSLTSLTELRLVGLDNTAVLKQNEVTFEVGQLQNLSLLQKLELHDIHLGEPDQLSSLLRLTSLQSISLKPPAIGMQFEYAPGVLYLGFLPNLEHFEFRGACSCPPVAMKLTTLIWEVDSNVNVVDGGIDESAALAWIEMKPKLAKIENFSFTSFCSNGAAPEITSIAVDIIRGSSTSLTALYFLPDPCHIDTSFLAQCTNLKSLTALTNNGPPCFLSRPTNDLYSNDTMELYSRISLPWLIRLTSLTHLMLDEAYIGRDIPAAMKSLQCLTNLEKLELHPGNLSCMAYLARGGAMTSLKELSIRKAVQEEDRGIYFHHRSDVMRTNDLEYFPAENVLPSLTTLKISHYFGAPEVWEGLGSLAPNVTDLSVDGNVKAFHLKKKKQDYEVLDKKKAKTLRELRWDVEVSLPLQIQCACLAFPNLKRLEVAKDYVLGARHFLKARTTREHYFDIDLEEIREICEEEKWMEIEDVQYLDPLSPEVLKYDERYRYSMEELEAVGEISKNSALGKREILKLRGKLADGVLVL